MPRLFTALTNTTETTFRGLATLTALYATYKWLYFLVVLRGSWTMAEALTWTIIAAVFLTPVYAINLARGE